MNIQEVNGIFKKEMEYSRRKWLKYPLWMDISSALIELNRNLLLNTGFAQA